MVFSQFEYSPHFRIVIFFFALFNAIICKHIPLFAFGFLLILFLLVIKKQLIKFLKFILLFGIPFLIILILVYGFLLKNNTYLSNYNGFQYGLLIFLRFVLLTSLFQVFLNISDETLLFAVNKMKLNQRLILLLFGSRSVLQEVSKKANQIITARFARGIIVKRNILRNIVQIPYLLKPLIIGVLISSVERSESWEQKNMIENFPLIKQEVFEFNKYFNFLSLIYVLLWTIIIILTQYFN